MHSSEARPDGERVTNVDIAIVGAGASGVLLATHLMASPSPPMTIALIGNTAAVGEGVAFSTVHAEHLLNVTASRMSAFDDAPDDFVQFLSRQGDAAFSASSASGRQNYFAERRTFAHYLRNSLNRYSSNAGLHSIRDEAVDIELDLHGATIVLASGRAVRSRAVVLAIGNFPRQLPFPAEAIDNNIRVDNAWDYDAIASIDADEDIAIIGSGLSMVDTALTLSRNRHRGRIHVISRHGLFPLPHASTSRRVVSENPLVGQSLKTLPRSLRRMAKNEIAAGNPWQFVMDDIRPHIQEIWTHLSDGEQRRFIRHAARYWEIHRHRIAPAVHETLERMQRSGQIVRHACRVQSMRCVGDACEIRIASARDGGETCLRVHRVVNSVGLQLNLRHVDNRLLRNLFARGLVKPGKHGIGLETDEHGALRSSDGKVERNFYTLGSTRIGQLWESIAVPELRAQAQHLARRLLSAEITSDQPAGLQKPTRR